MPAAGARHLTNAARYTSTEILAAEQAVLGAAADRYAAGYATVPVGTVELAVAQFEAAAGFDLSAEQRAVVTRLATAGHGVETVVGVAGAGKTTLMSALRAAHEAAGHTVAGAATAAAAAANLHTESGIPARTVASWLHRIEHGEGLAGVDVLVVDEAAMVDDRHLARLLEAAGATGTQIVAIGDPQQLRAIGVGGAFAAVHELVRGGELTENRRQQDDTERAALATWRTGQRAAALTAWAASGRVHAGDQVDDVHDQMTTVWARERATWTDPHERIDRLLLLAHTNADVDALNHRARAAARAGGDLTGPDHTWQITHAATGHRAGTRLRLAVGDQVMTLTNDRDLGVLNGHRGVVTAIDPPTATGAGRVQIERRQPGPDGPVRVRTWLAAGYLAAGGLTHAYAITAAKAQGLTADRALVYGNAMDAHVLYPAMSRDQARVDLYLALTPLEDHGTRARLGAPTDTDRLARAITAYTATLNTPPDTLISTTLGWTPPPIHHPAPTLAGHIDVEQLVDQVDVEPVDQGEHDAVRRQDEADDVAQDVDDPADDRASIHVAEPDNPALDDVAPQPQAGIDQTDVEHVDQGEPAAVSRVDEVISRIRARIEEQERRLGRRAGRIGTVDEAVLAELEAMGRRRYGWPSDQVLQRYLADAYVPDPADRRPSQEAGWPGPGNPIRAAQIVARAAQDAVPLLNAAAGHTAAAEAAEQAAAMHDPRLQDLYRRVRERQALLDQARARAGRLLTGRLHRGDLADAQDALARAVHTLEETRAQIDAARRTAEDHQQQAHALIRQAEPHLDRAGLTRDHRRDLTTAQLRDQMTDLAQATTTQMAPVIAAQAERLAAVTAELAHRDGLPTRARQAADAERRLQHEASVISSPGMRLAAMAKSPILPTREVARRWRPLADQIDPRLATDPTWPHLADAIDRVRTAGTDPAKLLPRLTGPDNPLPDTQPARALRHRLVAAHPAALAPAQIWTTTSQPSARSRYDRDPIHDLGRRGPSRGR